MMRTALLLTSLLLAACGRNDVLSEKDFVGSWYSSKANAVVRLNANNEWELLDPDGVTSHFGVWQVYDNNMTWSIRSGGETFHDINRVLSFERKSFKLKESNGAVTTYVRKE